MTPSRHPCRPRALRLLALLPPLLPLLLLGAMQAAAAQPGGSAEIYRCGNVYTNDPGSAGARDCQRLEGGNVTVIQGTSPHRAQSATSTPSAAPAAGSNRIDSKLQRDRDQQARQILGAELAQSQSRLSQLQAEYKDGQPERLGSERNYQRYLDRTAQLKADIERTQSDIAGIQRELSRLPAAP